MSAIKGQPSKANSSSSKKSLLMVVGVIAIASVLLFAYLMWYVAPEEKVETVKVIAVTDTACVGETLDGFAVNIGDCQAEPGQYVNAHVDQKTKERAALMNPTN